MLTILLALLQSLWVPPIQSEWNSDLKAKISITEPVNSISFEGNTDITINMLNMGGDIKISPFVNYTRGVVFIVKNRSGKNVAPLEPAPISPPVPVDSSKLILIKSGDSYKLDISEPSKHIFPKRGKYTLIAQIRMLNTNLKSNNTVEMYSKPFSVNVI